MQLALAVTCSLQGYSNNMRSSNSPRDTISACSAARTVTSQSSALTSIKGSVIVICTDFSAGVCRMCVCSQVSNVVVHT